MNKWIEEYLKERFQNISFLKIKENAELNIDGYELPSGGLDVPILNKELVEMIQEKKEGISVASIVRGVIETVGCDSGFLHNDEYKKLLYSFDPNVESYISYQGLKKAEEKEFVSALVNLKCLLFLNRDLNALYNYGLICQDIARMYHKAKDEEKTVHFLEEALNIFEEIVESHPEYPMSYYQLGYLYLNNKQYLKAKLNWKLALSLGLDEDRDIEVKKELDDMEYKVQYEQGYNLVIQGKPQEGLELLEPLVEEYSDWWNLLFFVALALRQLHRYEEAITYFEKILSLNESQPDTLCELALCYAGTMNFERASFYFSKALQMRPNDCEIMCNLGMIYLQTGDIKMATDYIEMAYELDPNDEITRACLQELNSRR